MSYSVVVIDDEKWVLEGFRNSIKWEDEGFSITDIGFNGQMALDIIEGNVPDVLITDVRMPGIDGISLLKRVKSSYPSVEVLMISGYRDFSYAQEALVNGAVGFIVKPFNPEEIKKQLRQVKANLLERDRSVFRQYMHDGSGNIDVLFRKFNIEAGGNRTYSIITFLYPRKKDQKSADFFFPLGGNRYVAIVPEEEEERAIKSDDTFLCAGVYHGLQGRKECRWEIERSIALSFGSFIDSSFKINVRDESRKANANKTCKSLFQSIDKQDREGVERWFVELKEDFLKGEYHVEDTLAFYNQLAGFINIRKENLLPAYFSLFELTDNYSSFDSLLEQMRDNIRALLKMPSMISNTGQHNPIVSRTLEYVNSHFTGNISVQNISEEFGVSASYLSQIFKKDTGNTLVRYIAMLRIDRAKQLLAETGFHIGEVSEQVGYTDYFYFTKIFKKYCGITPTEYKKNLI